MPFLHGDADLAWGREDQRAPRGHAQVPRRRESHARVILRGSAAGVTLGAARRCHRLRLDPQPAARGPPWGRGPAGPSARTAARRPRSVWAQPGHQPRLVAVRSEFHRSRPRRSLWEGLGPRRTREQSRRRGGRCPPCSRRHRRQSLGRPPGSWLCGTCGGEKGHPARHLSPPGAARGFLAPH